MRILVAGIGNIFLGDDAFGCELARRLARRRWPEGVVVRDFGLRCRDLDYELERGWDAVVLLDACGRGQAPGTVYRMLLDGDEARPADDPHAFTLAAVRRVPNMHLIGCEPRGFDPGELSAEVEAAMAVAEAMTADLIASMQVQEVSL